MSYATVNGLVLLEATIVLSRMGAWRANLVVDADVAPTSPITISLGDGPTAVIFKGTVAPRGGAYAGMSYLRVVGGAGGLRKPVSPMQYTACPGTLPVTQTLSEVGETPGTITADGTLDVWTRAASSAGEALTQLANNFGATWRVLSDGSVFFGPETWPDSGITPDQFDQMSVSPSDGWVQFAMEVPTMVPGTTVGGQRISLVKHTLTAGAVRSEAWVEDLETT